MQRQGMNYTHDARYQSIGTGGVEICRNVSSDGHASLNVGAMQRNG